VNALSRNNGAPAECINLTKGYDEVAESDESAFGAGKKINNFNMAVANFSTSNNYVAARPSAAGHTFVAMAAGPIDSAFVSPGHITATAVSCWSINQNKKLLQRKQGY
jgi:hypothetical protein